VRMKVVVALLALLGNDLAAQPDQPTATFRSSVELVPISAVVKDRRGRLVTSLSATDFEIFDNSQRRPIIGFQVDRSSPVTLALLLDISGSMRMGPKLTFARQVLEKLVERLEAGRDEAGLFTFDAALQEQQPFTVYPTTVTPVVDSLRPFGTTSLYDAIAATARRLAERASPRRAIVVITDGLDTSSALTPAEVSGLASSIDVPVYLVVTLPEIDADLSERGVYRSNADLRDLAWWTGGDLQVVSRSEHAGAAADQILSELRHQYLMAIESAVESEWRALDVRLRNRNLTVRARSGYFGRFAIPQ
jgi:Ca-activated chloride channel family protein